MKFDELRVYTALNGDKLKKGDRVIIADTMSYLRRKVADGSDIGVLKEIRDDNCTARFGVEGGCFDLLAYLVERKENCTNCRLCSRSIKDDPTQVCENYEPQVEPPANCETCSKADTVRCPVSNPPKKTGCCHWESKPARVCENCRNLERHGKDNNWCEAREIKLSDEAIKKDTCGYFKLVKEEPKTEQKAEKHYRPFRDTDELIKVWNAKIGIPKCLQTDGALTIPYIWVRKKINFSGLKGELITRFEDSYVDVNGRTIPLHVLFTEYEFLDGSSCGAEEC